MWVMCTLQNTVPTQSNKCCIIAKKCTVGIESAAASGMSMSGGLKGGLIRYLPLLPCPAWGQFTSPLQGHI